MFNQRRFSSPLWHVYHKDCQILQRQFVQWDRREKLKSFDTYDRASLRRMHFVRKKYGSWAKKSSVPPSEVGVSSDNGSSEDEEYEDRDVKWRTSEKENVTRIPSTGGVRARADANHPSLIGPNDSEASDNLNAHISSLGTCLEEIVLANDRRLTSLENRIDGLHEEVKEGMQVIWGQHDEMMVFLWSHFPLHGPDQIWPLLHFVLVL